MASMSVSDFRAHLRDALERVEKGEEIAITRDGKVAAVLVHPSRAHKRERAAAAFAGAEALRISMEEARHRPLTDGQGLSAEYAEELAQWIHETRERKR